MSHAHALAMALGALAVLIGLAWHWYWPCDWTGRRKSLKLKKRRNDWDD